MLIALWRYPGVLLNYLLHDKDVFLVDIAIMAIMKNEGAYLKEWIEYHRMTGVEKFYLCDNESTDNTKEILEPYIRAGTVEYFYISGSGASIQTLAYADIARRVRNSVKWLAVIDIDEFIVPVAKAKIIDVVNDLEAAVRRKERKKLFGLAVRWITYGYGGHYTKPDGLVTENFRKNAGADRVVKSIVNPRAAIFVPYFSIHTPIYLDLGYGRTETGEQNPWKSPVSVNAIRVNHYTTKSYEEYRKKIERNKAGITNRYTLPEYDPDYMSRYEDSIMDKYTAALKRAVAMPNL
jgi:glycosyltransferase involved in cell wall biosynthesis